MVLFIKKLKTEFSSLSEKNPKVAVLLAAYNGMHWLREQMESILSQKNVLLTVFVSVDVSVDGTAEFFYDFEKNNESVVMLPYGHVFGGASANFFRLIRDVDFSDYDAVAFSDQDDVWFPDKLARAWERIHVDGFDVYSSNVVAMWRDGRRRLVEKSWQQKDLDYFFEAAGPGCTYVFSQAAILDFKNFVNASCEALKDVKFHDWLAYAYCRSRGMKWCIDKKPSMYYRQHESNQIGANHGWGAWSARWKMLRSKSFRKQVNLIASLVSPERVRDISDNLFLLKNCSQLRRRPRDAFFLFLLILFGVY